MQITDYEAQLAATVGANELAFPMAEYDARLAATRAAMGAAGLDTLLVSHSCDLNYLTGYDTLGTDIYAMLILPRDGEPILHTMTVEIPAAVVTTWVEDRVFAEWYDPAGIDEQLCALLRRRGLDHGRIGIQPKRQGMRADLPAALAHHLGNASLVDATDLVGELRLIKSGEEIACLRRAAAITAEGVRASLRAIRPGAMDNDVCRAGYDAMIGAGADFLAIQPIVTSGKRAGGGHQMHRRQVLERGDTVFMEYGGCFKRYITPMMRCAVMGRPDDEMRHLEAHVIAAGDAIIAAARPGRTGHDIASVAAQAHAPVDDLAYFSGAYGYTIGVGYPPTWADTIGFMHIGSTLELKPGMAFHLPIALRVPGGYGVSLSESILITEMGCEVLTDQPRGLVVLDS